MTPFDVPSAALIVGTTSATIISLAKLRMRSNEQRNRVSDPEVADRLDRIEQAVAAIALEVDRMSESQRFTSRLLAERLPTPEALPGAVRGWT